MGYTWAYDDSGWRIMFSVVITHIPDSNFHFPIVCNIAERKRGIIVVEV